LQDIVLGGRFVREYKQIDQVITRKHRAISEAKEEMSNLHPQLEGELTERGI
jgi:hypothetical protein